MPKNELVKFLLSHQRTLEWVMLEHFVLPFKFATLLRDEAELVRLLSESESFLMNLGSRMKGCAEIDVIATWEVKKILQEIAEEDPTIIAAKKEMALGKGDSTFIGMLLAQALKRRADRWRQALVGVLKQQAKDQVDHDLYNDEMILNSSFLVEQKNQEAFYWGITQADAFYKGRLKFKCVGPLPPYSFATVTLKRFDPDEIKGAAGILRLNGKADLSEVKRIYKELSRECHPDTHPGSEEAFEKLNRAYELIADYCGEGAKSLAKEVVAHTMRLNVFRSSLEVSHAA